MLSESRLNYSITIILSNLDEITIKIFKLKLTIYTLQDSSKLAGVKNEKT